jgi:uncharacterized membrane protein YphA (DoxX/SURF4 family)
LEGGTVLNIVLWVVQVLLAALFLSSGIAKSVLTKERMIATGQTGVAPYPLPFIRVIAGLEVLGAIGLVLPQLTRVDPVLTPLAALGLATVMVGASVSHLRIHEPTQALAVNLPILLLCVFVAVGRLIAL